MLQQDVSNDVHVRRIVNVDSEPRVVPADEDNSRTHSATRFLPIIEFGFDKLDRVEDFEIRTANPEDAAAIAAILAAAFVEYESLYTAEGYAATTPGEEVIRNRFTEGKTWVAHVAGKIVGTVSVVPQPGPRSEPESQSQPKSLYIRSMAILPEARGHRIGEHLLSRIEDYALAHGFRRLTLSTTPFLNRAIRLYEKFGFTPYGSDDLFGTPLITMAKQIP